MANNEVKMGRQKDGFSRCLAEEGWVKPVDSWALESCQSLDEKTQMYWDINSMAGSMCRQNLWSA